MTIVFDVLSVLVALGALLSAVVDFKGREDVTELMKRLGYRPNFERVLGLIKVVGALGLLAGLAYQPIGIAAAVGFVIYFALAVRAHRSIDDSISDAFPAIVFLLLSLATLATGIFA